MSFNIQDISKIVYDILNQTKKRIPIFVVALHIYVTNNIFLISGKQTEIIVYMSLLGIICIIWEFFFAIKATQSVIFPWYTEISFAIYVSVTRFFNLIVICLFVTDGRPLSYLFPSIEQIYLTVAMSCTIVLNFVIDKIESTYWTDSWSKLYKVRIELIEESESAIDGVFTESTTATSAIVPK